MTNHQATLQEQDTAQSGVLYMAIEMGEKNWKLLFSSGEPKRNGQLRTYQRSIEGSDWESLEEMIKISKGRLKLADQTPVVSCYEAGQDGFYPHRQMRLRGIDNRVVDSASIEVNRRARRAKSDGLDVRKLLEMLVREGRGEVGVWRVVNVPSEEQEDRRRTHRELERLKKEDKQHRTRIRSLLKLEGIRPQVAPGGRGWERYLEGLKSQVRAHGWAEIKRQSWRLELVKEQIRELEALRGEALEASEQDPLIRMILALNLVRGIGEGSAWLLVMEFFGWRRFKNRRQVAGCAGLDPTPYDSGQSVREQGISKAGNKRVRWLMVELAWSWLRYQPGSRLSQWYQRRFGHAGKRQRRIGIVALARRLVVELWRYVEAGVIPQGAVLAPSPVPARAA